MATITCPHCAVPSQAEMPTDACQHFWDCPACGRLVKPQPGDCCVFCSYADRRCPSSTHQ
ncbi:MAG: GDCCVxC domain-containing (seleno)protein [Gemmatimonadota bacterium]